MLSNHYTCRILMKLKIFLDKFRKILKYKLSLKSVQREPSRSMRANEITDRQTDKTKLTVAFASAPITF
jgi:hypothetical protein